MYAGFFGAKLDSECPIVLADCVASLRENGLLYEGVFRIPGSAAIVKELKAEYNKEFNTKLHKDTKRVSVLQESSMGAGVHEIASLMKAFLKEIDGGLIPGRSAKQMTAVLKMQLPKEVCFFAADFVDSVSCLGRGQNVVQSDPGNAVAE